VAGIYIHIPFCKQACNYCDFHFTTYFRYAEQLVDAVAHEIAARKNYLGREALETIYIGGGTPSALKAEAIEKILLAVRNSFQLVIDTEISLEANPDDITPEKAAHYRNVGINRISMGVQSFRDQDLQMLNRRHTAADAVSSIEILLKQGFWNLSVDLMYGLPGQTIGDWESVLEQALRLDIIHFSAYHLSLEPGTELYYRKQKNKIQIPDEALSEAQFNLLVSKAESAGFEQYEISNFARDRKYSRHNTSYWTGKKYLGIGPSAHSFDGKERRWNTRGIMTYINSVNKGGVYHEREPTDAARSYNEYLMTALRTMGGVDLDKIEKEYGVDFRTKLISCSKAFIRHNNMVRKDNRLVLTQKGKFIADHIIAELFLT